MIFVLGRDGRPTHMAAAGIPSLDRLSPGECAVLVRELAADVRRVARHRDGDEAHPADVATEGDW